MAFSRTYVDITLAPLHFISYTKRLSPQLIYSYVCPEPVLAKILGF